MLNLHYQYQNRLIMQRLMLWVVLFTTSLGLSAKTFQPYYHSVKSEKWWRHIDPIGSLWIVGTTVTWTKFYTLNDMKKGLNFWRIRNTNFPLKFTTTMAKASDYFKIDDVDVALGNSEIQRKTPKKGLRKASFKDNRQLWVPYHKLGCGALKKMSLYGGWSKEIRQKVEKINAGADKKRRTLMKKWWWR